MPPALAGGFLTTAPPGKPLNGVLESGVGKGSYPDSIKPNKADLGEESILQTTLEEVCEVEMGPFPALST